MNLPLHPVENVMFSLTELIEELQQMVKELGGCDHSVGICMCDTIRKLETAQSAHAALLFYLR